MIPYQHSISPPPHSLPSFHNSLPPSFSFPFSLCVFPILPLSANVKGTPRKQGMELRVDGGGEGKESKGEEEEGQGGLVMRKEVEGGQEEK